MTIVILGAGDIGAAVARRIAAADVVSRVVLVDEAGAVAAGKALDIAQAAPVDGYSTTLAGTDDVGVATGAGVIVLADRCGAPAAEWSGEDGLRLIERIGRLNQTAPIVCACPGQGPVIDRGVHELGLSSTRVFGTAPDALRAAVVSLVALDAEAAPSEVSLMVMGRAPDEIIVPWESASISGRRAIDVLAPPVITRLGSQLPRLWPPGATVLGAAAARVIRSMLTRAPLVHALQIAQRGGEGRAGRSAMLPARLDARGIARVEAPLLASRDRVRLDTALAR